MAPECFKDRIPRARLVAVSQTGKPRIPVNTMKITYIAEAFDALCEEINNLLYGED